MPRTRCWLMTWMKPRLTTCKGCIQSPVAARCPVLWNLVTPLMGLLLTFGDFSAIWELAQKELMPKWFQTTTWPAGEPAKGSRNGRMLSDMSSAFSMRSLTKVLPKKDPEIQLGLITWRSSGLATVKAFHLRLSLRMATWLHLGGAENGAWVWCWVAGAITRKGTRPRSSQFLRSAEALCTAPGSSSCMPRTSRHQTCSKVTALVFAPFSQTSRSVWDWIYWAWMSRGAGMGWEFFFLRPAGGLKSRSLIGKKFWSWYKFGVYHLRPFGNDPVLMVILR